VESQPMSIKTSSVMESSLHGLSKVSAGPALFRGRSGPWTRRQMMSSRACISAVLTRMPNMATTTQNSEEGGNDGDAAQRSYRGRGRRESIRLGRVGMEGGDVGKTAGIITAVAMAPLSSALRLGHGGPAECQDILVRSVLLAFGNRSPRPQFRGRGNKLWR
jgi:hypothetical protein